MKEQKKKISLDELKVQSFVTSLPEAGFNTIKGGNDDCESQDENICECENESGGGGGGGAPGTFLPATCSVGC